MIIQVFAVYDTKAAAFNMPFFVHNKELAIRSFTSAVNDPSLDLNKYPTDFALFHIGSYDDQNASIESFVTPENLGLAANYLINTSKEIENAS